MSKNDVVEVSGTVTEKLPGTKFKVALENNMEVICTLNGKLRMHNISIIVGDKVDVEISPYDLTKGRISWRYK